MQCRKQRAEGGDRIGGPSSPGRLPPTPPLLIHFPQAPGARSARLAPRHAARGAVAPSGPAVRPSSRRTPGRWPGTRLGPGLFISLRRRALAPPLSAPCGARRGRAVRTCGPALFAADSWSVARNPTRAWLIHFPQAPGARSARLAPRHAARGAVAPSGPAVRPSSRRTPGRWPGTRLGPGLFISLKRRALAPRAWLRAMRRAARSRRPDLRSGPLRGGLLVGGQESDSGLAYSFPSIGALAPLGSAPCGARRGRAVRTCGPALPADSWSVARNPTRLAARALRRWGRRGGKGRRHLRPPSALRGEGERGRWGTRAWRRHRCRGRPLPVTRNPTYPTYPTYYPARSRRISLQNWRLGIGWGTAAARIPG